MNEVLSIIIIIIIIVVVIFLVLIFYEFFTPEVTGGFHSSPSGSKSFQLYRTFLNIFADLSSAVVWTISILFWISSSCSFFSRFQGLQLWLVSPFPSYSISFFSSLARSRYLSSFLLSFTFILVCWKSKIL